MKKVLISCMFIIVWHQICYGAISDNFLPGIINIGGEILYQPSQTIVLDKKYMSHSLGISGNFSEILIRNLAINIVFNNSYSNYYWSAFDQLGNTVVEHNVQDYFQFGLGFEYFFSLKSKFIPSLELGSYFQSGINDGKLDLNSLTQPSVYGNIKLHYFITEKFAIGCSINYNTNYNMSAIINFPSVKLFARYFFPKIKFA